MKRFYLMMMFAAMATMGYSQTADQAVKRADLTSVPSDHFVPSKVISKTPSADDIITEQPAGTLKRYLRTGRYMMGSGGQVFEYDQSGRVAKVVFGDNGKDVWFLMPLSTLTYPAWVRGTLSDDGTTISIPAGQQVVYDVTKPDPASGYPGGVEYAFRLHLLEMQDNGYGGYTYGIAEGDPDIVWTVDAATGELRLTCTDVDAYNIMGIIYDTPDDPASDGQWNGYADYATVYVPFSEEPVSVPAGLTTEPFGMNYEYNDGYNQVQILARMVDVAFDGDDVYMTHFSKAYPETWIKGKIDGDKIRFPRQLMLISNIDDPVYFNAFDMTMIEQPWGTQIQKTLSYEDVVFKFDAEKRTFSTDMNCNVNPSAIRFSGQEMFERPSFSPYYDVAATPADPGIIRMNGFNATKGYWFYADIRVPPKDVDGNFIDPAKLSFCFYTSEDEVYHFVRDNYVRTTATEGWDYDPAWEDGLSEIPYTWTDAVSDFSNERVNFYYGHVDRLGLQSIYRGGGEERRSNIFFWGEGIFNVGISDAAEQSQAVSTSLYDLMGRRIESPARGITLMSVRRADGSVVTRKVISKK